MADSSDPDSDAEQVVDLSVAAGVAWLTLRRPEVLNAIDGAVTDQFARLVGELREREDVRVVVTQGAGRAFCAGSDLHYISPMSPADAASAERRQGDTFALLDTLPQPTIAALHGYVLGGGVGLALYHDFRIAAASATLGIPEVELGWAPPWAMGRLVDVVGAASARWLSMTCTRLTSEEAKAVGLVNQVVPDETLAEHVEGLARKLVGMPAAALRHTKDLINRMSPLRGAEWDAAAAAAFEQCYGTPDARRNVAAFVARSRDKRRPVAG